MPQLAQLAEAYASQLFWLLLVLGAIYFFVGRGIVPKVEATVDDRDAKIAADLAAAEQARGEADAMEEGWRKRMNDAQAEIQAGHAEAKAKADANAVKRVAKADAQISETVDAAAVELAAAREAALSEIDTVASDSARDIVAKLTGAKVTAAQAKKAVKEAMSHA